MLWMKYISLNMFEPGNDQIFLGTVSLFKKDWLIFLVFRDTVYTEELQEGKWILKISYSGSLGEIFSRSHFQVVWASVQHI